MVLVEFAMASLGSLGMGQYKPGPNRIVLTIKVRTRLTYQMKSSQNGERGLTTNPQNWEYSLSMGDKNI